MTIKPGTPFAADVDAAKGNLTHEQIIDKYLHVGDVITHTRCMGHVEEHIFSGRDGRWLCGRPTQDTKKIDGLEGSASSHWTNDIAPSSVTHINRNPVEALPLLARKL